MAEFGTAGKALLEHLQKGCTTVCRCWKVRRSDGEIFGFTDHDGDLKFDGIRFLAASGFAASSLEQGTGLAVDNSEAVGVLSTEALTEEDIRTGRYDGAEVTSWIVNWRDTSQCLVQFSGTLGEVSCTGDVFRAELRGQTEALNQQQGRVYQSVCSAVLGDAKCRFDLDTPGYCKELPLQEATDGHVLSFPDAGEFVPRWFERGHLTVLNGAATGLVGLIKRDQIVGNSREIELWQSLRSDLAIGDRVRLVPGCDRREETCKVKFSNYLNYRGFPHIPGEDWLTAYPKQGNKNDGGSRNG